MDLEAEKIVQNAYFTAEFSYFLHNPSREILFEGPVAKFVYSESDYVLFVLCEESNVVRTMNRNYEKILDYHITLKGKKSSSRIVDFDYDPDTKVLGMISEDRWVYFCLVDFLHRNLDTTLKAMKFDELQTRLWFLKGAGTWATAGNDFVVRIWKLLSDGELTRVHEIHEHTDVVTQVTFASKIECLLTSSLDGCLRMWAGLNYRLRFTATISAPAASSQKKSTLKKDSIEGVRGFLISNSSDNLLVCWGFSNKIKVYEASNMIGFELMAKLEGHMGVIFSHEDCDSMRSE